MWDVSWVRLRVNLDTLMTKTIGRGHLWSIHLLSCSLASSQACRLLAMGFNLCDVEV